MTSFLLLSKYLLIMELCFETMLHSNLGKEISVADSVARRIL